MPTTVSVLGGWLDSFAGPPPLIGYSQGGRMALLVALERPAAVDRLILVSASPGIEDDRERADRRSQDAALADRIETIGIDAFLDEWSAGPIAGTAHLSDDARRADRSVRRENTATGLAAALRGLGQGSQPYVGDRIASLLMPVLTISGERDDRYGRIADAIADAAPDGRHVVIQGAGHNVIQDAPEALMIAVAEFCAS